MSPGVCTSPSYESQARAGPELWLFRKNCAKPWREPILFTLQFYGLISKRRGWIKPGSDPSLVVAFKVLNLDEDLLSLYNDMSIIRSEILQALRLTQMRSQTIRTKLSYIWKGHSCSTLRQNEIFVLKSLCNH